MRTLAALAVALMTAVPVSAQSPERGYLDVSGGMHSSTGTFTDRFTYTVNVEEATTEARYPSKSGTFFDGGGGIRLWKMVGLGVHLSRSSVSGTADTDSQIPHPLSDDRDRQVSGQAVDLVRTETAVHALLFYARSSGRWRVRISAGPSFFTFEQEVVTGIVLDEEYPFDTATFRRATTARGKQSAAGFNLGADVTRMFGPRIGAGAIVRYARGSVDFNVDGIHRVSTNAGGVQVGAGLRFVFR